jgi:polyisoprenyl-phosphate glycosyltransferase
MQTENGTGDEPTFSLVIPVYGNEQTLVPLIAAVTELNRQLKGELEAIFVVDGSPDHSFSLLQNLLPAASFRSTLIALSRNFGSFSAIRRGLAAARGPYSAVMAADLQEPPELIIEFFESLQKNEADVVLGTRTERSDPWFTRSSSRMFWALYRRFVQKEMPRGGVDVFACNRKVREALLVCDERNSSMVGLLLWVGFRRKFIPYIRRPRPAGRSGWTMGKRIRYMSDSIYSFSDLPIRVMVGMGVAAVSAAIILAGVVFAFWLAGRIEVQGYTPIMLVLLFFGGMTVFCIGIVGSYVARAYDNTKGRPNFIEAFHYQYHPAAGETVLRPPERPV